MEAEPEVYRRFGGKYYLHFHGRIVNQISNQQEASRARSLPTFRRKALPPSSVSKSKPRRKLERGSKQSQFTYVSDERTAAIFRVEE
jgi:hypothetical protein